MKEAQARIKEGLAHILGEVSFEDPNKIKIFTTVPKITRDFIDYIKIELPRYQDMIIANLKIIDKEEPGRYRGEFMYILNFYPSEIFKTAVHHLPPLIDNFSEKKHSKR